MMRVGLFPPVYVKTERSQEIRILLTARKFLQPNMIDAENNLRGLVQNSCLKVGAITRLQFEVRVIDLIKERRHLTVTIAPLLEVWRVLREQYQRMPKAMEQLATDDGICRLLMTAPRVAPLVSLTLRAGIDEVACLSQSRPVLGHFGLAPARYQSGELDRGRGISKCGYSSVRWVLVEAAGIIMRQRTKSSPLKVWGMALAKRRGPAKAHVAAGRRLATILHRMWIDNTEYHWQAQSA